MWKINLYSVENFFTLDFLAEFYEKGKKKKKNGKKKQKAKRTKHFGMFI